MEILRVGDEVEVLKDNFPIKKGDTGFVIGFDGWIGEEYPWVVKTVEGKRAAFNRFELRKINDEKYEYAVRRIGEDKTYLIGNFWSDEEDRRQMLNLMNQEPRPGIEYKLVKRRKAGPEEDVE